MKDEQRPTGVVRKRHGSLKNEKWPLREVCCACIAKHLVSSTEGQGRADPSRKLTVAEHDFCERQDVFAAHAHHQALPGDGGPSDEDEKDVG